MQKAEMRVCARAGSLSICRHVLGLVISYNEFVDLFFSGGSQTDVY